MYLNRSNRSFISMYVESVGFVRLQVSLYLLWWNVYHEDTPVLNQTHQNTLVLETNEITPTWYRLHDLNHIHTCKHTIYKPQTLNSHPHPHTPTHTPTHPHTHTCSLNLCTSLGVVCLKTTCVQLCDETNGNTRKNPISPYGTSSDLHTNGFSLSPNIMC